MLSITGRESRRNDDATYDDATYGDTTHHNENATYDDATYGDTTYDNATYENTANDDASYSSRSSGSDTFGSATLASMALNERERRKWSAWNKKDQDSAYTGASSYETDHTTDSRRRNGSHIERRARAHEQLLMHAYTALSKPPPSAMAEKGTVSQMAARGGPGQGIQPQTSGGSEYQSGAENQAPSGQVAKASKSILKQRKILENFCV